MKHLLLALALTACGGTVDPITDAGSTSDASDAALDVTPDAAADVTDERNALPLLHCYDPAFPFAPFPCDETEVDCSTCDAGTCTVGDASGVCLGGGS